MTVKEKFVIKQTEAPAEVTSKRRSTVTLKRVVNHTETTFSAAEIKILA